MIRGFGGIPVCPYPIELDLSSSKLRLLTSQMVSDGCVWNATPPGALRFQSSSINRRISTAIR
jgi:hypothetical protein